MYIGDEGQQLPCKFYDVPGIEKTQLEDEELEKFVQRNIDDLQGIIDGKMILDVDVSALNITNIPLKFKLYISKYKYKGLQIFNPTNDPKANTKVAV